MGFRSCFYRAVPMRSGVSPETLTREFKEGAKTFDPKAIYGTAPNPTEH